VDRNIQTHTYHAAAAAAAAHFFSKCFLRLDSLLTVKIRGKQLSPLNAYIVVKTINQVKVKNVFSHCHSCHFRL